MRKGEIFEKVFLNEPSVDLHIVQEAGSRVKIHLIDVLNDEVRCTKEVHHRVVIEQQGEGCVTEIFGLAYLRGEERVTTETHVKHAVGGGVSNQLIKFVLDDESRGHFIGDLNLSHLFYIVRIPVLFIHIGLLSTMKFYHPVMDRSGKYRHCPDLHIMVVIHASIITDILGFARNFRFCSVSRQALGRTAVRP